MREDINYTRREDDKQDPNDFPQNGYDNPAFQNDGKSTQNGKIKKHKKKEKKDANKKSSKAIVGFFELFSFADGWDILLMVIGILCALGSGTGIPLLTVVFGGMTDSFVHTGIPSNMSNAANSSSCGVAPVTDIQAEITRFCYYFVAIGCAAFVLSFFQIWTFLVSAKRQAMRIRQKFFRAVLHQDMSWFDSNKIGILNNRLTDDINNIHEGLGDKICICVQISSTFLTGIIIGFVHGWKLTLVILSVSPLLALSAIVWSKLIASFTMKELAAYAKAGAVAEEILTAIRTVVAFNGQKNALAKYNANLNEAKKIGIKKSITTNISIGFSQFASCASYALAFWYGTKLTVSEPEVYTIGTVLTIFFAVKVGTFTLVQAAPNMEGIANARAAAFEVYRIINQPRIIDSSSKEGHKPDRLIGHIEFKDIHFSYPSRPDSQILKGLNLKVEAGTTIALVGSSGCGKSTTIQLLQRFYDPQHGEIILDGHDVRTLNVKWLRENIGVVSQEPVLFGTTIGENIRYGREDVTDAEIEQAAKEANAYDFISKLPDKFNTIVGERGSQLSGGQKQRIAIARAIIRNPKILLLDEATSALDTQSEAIVQAALDTARNGRTTIVIAHRLSTIRTADVIAGFQNGVVVEQGSHNELMKTKGIYNSLVMLQNYEDSNKEDGDKECSSDEEEEANSVEGEECNLEEITPNIHTVEGLETLRMQSLQRQSSKRKSKKSSKKQSKAKIPAQKVEEVKEDLPEVSLRRIFALNKPEWLYITIGVIAAAIAAGIFPTFAIIFGKAIGAFQEQDPIKRTHKTDLLSLMFLMLGLISVAAYMIMGFTFGNSGETLTMRIRSLSFKALLRQDIGLFDDHKNAVGVLITRLATDASQVKGITGSRLGFITMTVSTLLAAITVSFIHGWQLTLFILTCIPIMIGTYFIKMVSMGGHASRDQKALEEAGRISTEAVENIRTVVSLTREDTFYERYNTSLSGPYRDALCKAPWYGLTYAIAQAMNFFFNASVFRFGAWLVAHCLMEFQHVFIVFAAVIFSTMSVGHSSSLAPDFGKAKISARRIFQLLDRKPPIDSYSEEGDILSDFKGNIEFKDVHFVYPTRPTAQVLQGLNIKVSRGQTLALVGSSGCGKSTSIQLLERFYDPVEGQVFADGMDIKSLNLKWLRSQLGIVSQEPILFDCSISENIQYGDNSRLVTQEEVEAAALTANIHSFIQELPDGYNTRVGEKGTQLSGGQKQRIAIARALVQKPKVLLLDEATSALDTESEKMVQKALDDARQGRTCIVIAHRLTTVQNADIIAVIENGKVVEHGTHNQLLEKQGAYYALVNSRV